MENTVQRFIYSTLLYEGLEDLANEIVIKQGLLSDERLEYITREKEVVQIGQNPEMIFQLLRKKYGDDQSRSIGEESTGV